MAIESREKISFITLDGGRRLAFSTWGDPEGEPVMFFHGWPGSRLVGATLDENAANRRIRLITPDRPGIGGSDFQAERRLSDWSTDVAALAEDLQLESFSIIGYSGGGPYALACAHALADRLKRVILVSSMGPTCDPLTQETLPKRMELIFSLVRLWPNAMNLPAVLMDFGLRHASTQVLKKLIALTPPDDARILNREEIFEALRAEFIESFRQGTQGVAQEVHLLSQPWGFVLDEIQLNIDLWHGELDQNIPVALGRHLASLLPHCRTHILPAAGHYYYFELFDEILDACKSW